MNSVYTFSEIAATFIEIFIALSAAGLMSEKEELDSTKVHILVIGTSCLFTIIVSVLNHIETFSFFTVFLGIFLTAILAKIVYKGTLLCSTLGSVIAYFVIHSLDYIVLFSMGVAFETPIYNRYSFSSLLLPGVFRTLFLCVDKALDIFIFLLLKRHIKRLQYLRKSFHVLLLILSSTVYLIMTILVSLIVSDSMIAMQIAVIVAWVFMLLGLFSLIAILMFFSSHQEEREALHLLQTTNSMMEDNYARLHRMQDELSRRNHDINNHLELLQAFLRENKTEEALAYTDLLLTTSREKATLCHSGNAVIDAILNSKVMEAKEQNIRFEFQVNFSLPTDITPADLCAVLANQIDNAFDACKRIEAEKNRFIKVHIWQKDGSIAIFQVTNSVRDNPFAGNKSLLSTKTDRSRPHGLGIKSIRETASKYGGTLENAYRDGEFISIAFLNFEIPQETKEF